MGDLMMLGQEIMKGGFPFDACTELVKNKVELVEFKVPVKYLEDGIQEDEEMGLDFGGIGEPPLVTSVNEDWKASVNQETGLDAAPEKGDRLVFVGGQPAKEMAKDEFDSTIEELCKKAKEEAMESAATEEGGDGTGEVEMRPIKMSFTRGLDVDFAERFRIVLPNVLRKLIGVPIAEGQAFARNLDADGMQKCVLLLMRGGIKKFEDLAQGAGVEVSFEQSLKSALPMRLKSLFGFSLSGAERFCEALDPSDGVGLYSFLVRLKQLVGFGDLEAMFYVITSRDMVALDYIHKHRYKPRIDLNRLLASKEEMDKIQAQQEKQKQKWIQQGKDEEWIAKKMKKTKQLLSMDNPPNLVLMSNGKFELHLGEDDLGEVHEDTIAMVLQIWRESMDTHTTPDVGPLEYIDEFSSEDVIMAIRGAKADPMVERMKVLEDADALK